MWRGAAAASPSPPTTIRACSPPDGAGCSSVLSGVGRHRHGHMRGRDRRRHRRHRHQGGGRRRDVGRVRGRTLSGRHGARRLRRATNTDALRGLVDTCDDTWRGVIPPGGPCETYAACAEPAVSGGASAGASCVNSICVQVVRQPAGASCNDTMMACDPFAATCVSGTCAALPGAGEACAGSCRGGFALHRQRLRCRSWASAPLARRAASARATGAAAAGARQHSSRPSTALCPDPAVREDSVTSWGLPFCEDDCRWTW